MFFKQQLKKIHLLHQKAERHGKEETETKIIFTSSERKVFHHRMDTGPR